MQWYFDNLLPEEGQRQLIAKAAKIGTEDALLAEVEQENRTIAERHPELKATLGGEMRCLLAIVNIVIAEMCAQIS